MLSSNNVNFIFCGVFFLCLVVFSSTYKVTGLYDKEIFSVILMGQAGFLISFTVLRSISIKEYETSLDK